MGSTRIALISMSTLTHSPCSKTCQSLPILFIVTFLLHLEYLVNFMSGIMDSTINHWYIDRTWSSSVLPLDIKLNFRESEEQLDCKIIYYKTRQLINHGPVNRFSPTREAVWCSLSSYWCERTTALQRKRYVYCSLMEVGLSYSTQIIHSLVTVIYIIIGNGHYLVIILQE